MSTESNKRTVRTHLECIDRNDFDAARALAPEMAAYFNGSDKAMNAEEHEGMVREILKAFANCRHVILSQVAEGDWVATRRNWTGVHIGTFNGIPASNRPFSVATSSFDRVVDGKIVEHHALLDMMDLMTKIGAAPAAA